MILNGVSPKVNVHLGWLGKLPSPEPLLLEEVVEPEQAAKTVAPSVVPAVATIAFLNKLRRFIGRQDM